ncbi:MAG: DUF373 family protein [Candidatus Hydrothermarchaeaceae archaeon]
MEYNKILVVVVDRDGDISKKIGIDGPIYGRDNILDAAVKLGVADPVESDTNTMFEGVRLAERLKVEGKKVELVVLVGSENIGSKSDIKLSEQLDDALSRHHPDGVAVVTDGAEDEYILPVVQSRAKVIAVDRVIVKQSERLESTYYVIQEFLKEIVNDPKLSRLLIGLPGVAALLYMAFGQHGWRLTVGVIGVFLIIKGFALESTVQRVFNEIRSSLVVGRISFLTYVVAALITIVGFVAGYDEVIRREIVPANLVMSAPAFLLKAVDFFAAAGIVALIGKSIDAFLEKREMWKYIIAVVFIISLDIIAGGVSRYLLKGITEIELIYRVSVGVAISILAVIFIKSVWKKKRK